MNKVTLLLGAGFSKDAGYKTSDELSQELFEFTSCYSNPVIDFIFKKFKKAKFNYEEFYDFLLKFNSTRINVKSHSKKVYNELQNTFPTADLVNILSDFENKFNSKIFESLNISVSESNMRKYSYFANFIRQIGKDSQMNIFSLNHDLLVEKIFLENEFMFSDGFEDSDRFHYILNKPGNQTKKFRHFTNTFSHATKIYKLHGSIDLYYLQHRMENTIEFVKTTNIEQLYDIVESTITDKHSTYAKYDAHSFPRYLTGKKSKKYFLKTPLFNDIFTAFEEELLKTNCLIIIGYSFEDYHINQILKELFAKRVNDTQFKPIIVDFCRQESDMKKFTKKVFSKIFNYSIETNKYSMDGLFKIKSELAFFLFTKGNQEFFKTRSYKVVVE